MNTKKSRDRPKKSIKSINIRALNGIKFNSKKTKGRYKNVKIQ